MSSLKRNIKLAMSLLTLCFYLPVWSCLYGSNLNRNALEGENPLGSAIRLCLRNTAREGGTGARPEGNPALFSPFPRTARSARHARAQHPRRGLPSARDRLRPPSRYGTVRNGTQLCAHRQPAATTAAVAA